MRWVPSPAGRPVAPGGHRAAGAAFELRQITRVLRANKLVPGRLGGHLGIFALVWLAVMVLYYSLVLMCLAHLL